MKDLLKDLTEQAKELIALGDSREKARGCGMMEVIKAVEAASRIPQKDNRPNYFDIVNQGWNTGLEREEIQVHCGENGNLMIIKTEEGYIVDAIDVGGNNINTMCVWEDDINPLDDYEKDDDGNCKYCGQKCFEGEMCDEQQAGGFNEESGDPNNFSLAEQEDFLDEWGQLTDEVCDALDYDEKTSDDLLMLDFFFYEPKKYWIPKASSFYTPREQSIADYLKTIN